MHPWLQGPAGAAAGPLWPGGPFLTTGLPLLRHDALVCNMPGQDAIFKCHGII